MDTLTKAMYEVCRQHPERIAVVDCDKSTTYAELERQSNIIAHKIYGITRGKNAFIVLLLPRRVCAITAMFASQKAGCAYVPINADYPAERINYVIKDCEAAVVVTTAECLRKKKAAAF